MREGSLEAPVRHPIEWETEAFYDEAALDAELRRVFDVCHGCRRCFNLCDSFPMLFDFIDESDTGELDSVESKQFKPVVDACTLCDMCFLTKCPYVPPHEFNLDFPHLMVRYRAVERKKGHKPLVEEQLAKTDRNGQAVAPIAGLANWASDRNNKLTRPLMQSMLGLHAEADLPKYQSKPLMKQAKPLPALNDQAPAAKSARKAKIYTTCFANYNDQEIAESALAVLRHNGVDASFTYAGCCGMPKMERGDLDGVAETAGKVAAALRADVEAGFTIVAPVPSCALMMKFEWPLICPEDENVQALAAAVSDIDEYIVDLLNTEGLTDGMAETNEKVFLHLPCHSRAQNFGQKSAEMLRQIPGIQLEVVERCSGHGGSWGMMKDNFDTAIKIGKPVARQACKQAPDRVVSACPLAGPHILQGMEKQGAENVPEKAHHPVQIMARAYGLAS
jgi:glycerol-3-phosphate dehydrogenase subunit C